MSKNRPNRALFKTGLFAHEWPAGQRRPTKEQFEREVTRNMLDLMRNPGKLEGTGVSRVEAICKKCDWPLKIEQVEASMCPTCGKLRNSEIGYKAMEA